MSAIVMGNLQVFDLLSGGLEMLIEFMKFEVIINWLGVRIFCDAFFRQRLCM